MGGFLQTEERTQVDVVGTSLGIVTHGGTTYQKGRLWLLGDRRVILCVPSGTNRSQVARIELSPAVSSSWQSRSKLMTATLEDGSTISVNAKGCGCGAGAVGNAGPIAEPHNINRVRSTDWHTVSPT